VGRLSPPLAGVRPSGLIFLVYSSWLMYLASLHLLREALDRSGSLQLTDISSLFSLADVFGVSPPLAGGTRRVWQSPVD